VFPAGGSAFPVGSSIILIALPYRTTSKQKGVDTCDTSRGKGRRGEGVNEYVGYALGNWRQGVNGILNR
jgi:hypothetical protein